MLDINEIKINGPPSIKSVIIPEDGYVLMEGDWKQAELFVLGYLSGDQNMISALETPGVDLHDRTTIQSFGITVQYPDGKVAIEDDLIALAKKDKKQFDNVKKTLQYIDAKGNHLSTSQFKLLRVAGKSISFGLPYGRGPQAIAVQVKAETGTDKDLSELQSEMQIAADNWKNVLYPDAWKFLMQSNRAVQNPGYLINPWGRKRVFPYTTDRKLLAELGREAQNWKIQSSVSDLCMLALYLINQYRYEHKLNFKICNQIHDAILFEVPIPEIEATKQMIHATMGSIIIPIPNRPLKIGVDIEVLSRWGDKIED